MEITLRPYQETAVEALRQGIRDGKKNILLAAATGAGKTLCAAHLIDECRKKRKRALFIVDRTVLCAQTSAVFDQYGIPHGVIMSDHWRFQPYQLVQVASAQTLARRKWPEDVSLVVVDEAHVIHRNVAERIGKREVVTIGLSATPFQKGLGKLYDDVVTVIPTHTLIRDGYLAPYRIFAPSEPDMEGAEVDWKGEWKEAEAEKRSMPIIGDVVREYLNKGDNKKFIAVGVSVEHCRAMQAQFMAAGVQCGLYTYQTPDSEREQMVNEFRKRDGYLRGLISVAALSRGFDVPCVEVIIMARPLRKAIAEHIQVLGRGLRRDPENPDKVLTILDHSGNCVRFFEQTESFFEDGIDALDEHKITSVSPKPKKERDPVKCPKCSAVHKPRPACPSCGHEYPRRNHVIHKPGELAELGAGNREDRRAVFAQLRSIQQRYSYQPGWTAHQFKTRFGVWPAQAWDEIEPQQPTPEIERWVRSQMIRWAKSRRKSVA